MSGALAKVAALLERARAALTVAGEELALLVDVGERNRVARSLQELEELAASLRARVATMGAGSLSVHVPSYAAPARLPQSDPALSIWTGEQAKATK